MFNIGDIVSLSSSESDVKGSLSPTLYNWDDRMRSMLGKQWMVLEVWENDILTLVSPLRTVHSQVASRYGKWYFPSSVLKSTGRRSYIDIIIKFNLIPSMY